MKLSIVLGIDIALWKPVIISIGSYSLRLETKSLRGPAKFLRPFIVWQTSHVSHCSMLLLGLLASAHGPLQVPYFPSLCMGRPISLACSPTNPHLISFTGLTHPFTSDITSLQKPCWHPSQSHCAQLCALWGPSSLYIVLTTAALTHLLIVCLNSFKNSLATEELGLCVFWLTMNSSRPSIVFENRRDWMNN